MNFQIYLILILILILQRFSELYLSSRNEKILRTKAAIEYGQDHYIWMKILHAAWFVSLILEAYTAGKAFSLDMTLILMSFILVCQVVRFWCMFSLKEHWTTKILILPQSKLIKTGPYKYFSHPNYTVVMAEFILVPLMFQCYVTLFIFSLLNFILLKRRITVENFALRNLA